MPLSTRCQEHPHSLWQPQVSPYFINVPWIECGMKGWNGWKLMFLRCLDALISSLEIVAHTLDLSPQDSVSPQCSKESHSCSFSFSKWLPQIALRIPSSLHGVSLSWIRGPKGFKGFYLLICLCMLNSVGKDLVYVPHIFKITLLISLFLF